MLRDLISGNFQISNLIIHILSSIAVIFITMPVHEWAHGFIATKLGDPTPRYQGRLTLNPFAHIDYGGALCILLFGVGWAKAVQVNPRNFQNPKMGMAITACAGPVANVLTATVSMIFANLIVLLGDLTIIGDTIYYSQMFWVYIYWFFTYIAQINVALAVFNMIPIPPFDGSRIMFAILPDRYYWKVMQHERILMIILLAIIATGVLSAPLGLATDTVFGFIDFITTLPFKLFV